MFERAVTRPEDRYITRDESASPGPTEVLYATSYYVTRMLVGIIGVSLPLVLAIGENWFIDGPADVRGSISSYYHSSMNDIFVGFLFVIGVLLVSYMAGTWKIDFWVSALAGVAVLMVAMFPTQRPGIPAGDDLCGAEIEPPGCAPIQQRWGEDDVALVHYASAATFFVALVVISYLFGRREQSYAGKTGLKWFHYGCAVGIAAGIAVIVLGQVVDFSFWVITPMYLGEVIAIVAFALSWLVKGWGLLRAVKDHQVSPTAS